MPTLWPTTAKLFHSQETHSLFHPLSFQATYLPAPGWLTSQLVNEIVNPCTYHLKGFKVFLFVQAVFPLQNSFLNISYAKASVNKEL